MSIPTIRIQPVRDRGVIDGLDYAESRRLGRELPTEVRYAGTRVLFRPTREALDRLAADYGADAFSFSCRTAWRHLYAAPRRNSRAPFRFVTQPYPHQREGWEAMREREYYALEWEMGLGKTKTILDVVHLMYANDRLDGLLVVTEKGVHRKWATSEVEKHLPDGLATAAYWRPGIVDAGMWTGPSARQRTSILDATGLVIAAINFESLHRARGRKFCERFLRSRRAGMVVDESHRIKSPSAAATKAALALGRLAERRWIATGTMSTGSTLDAWAQYTFLHPDTVRQMPYHEFQAEFAVRERVGSKTYLAWEYDRATRRSHRVRRPVMAVVGYRNEDRQRAMLDPHRSRRRKSECIDLPPKLYRRREVVMTDDQRRAYVAMRDRFRAELSGGARVTARSAMAKVLRLQQIACGYVVPDGCDMTAEDIPGVPLGETDARLDAFLGEAEKISGSCVVWSHKRYTLRVLASALREAYGDTAVVEYHGGIADDDKARNLRRYQDGDARWFVANPQSGGTGIDLVAGGDMIYYDSGWSLGLRLQSEDRFHRIGQQAATCTITDIVCADSVDEHILASLRAKKDVAASVMGDGPEKWLT